MFPHPLYLIRFSSVFSTLIDEKRLPIVPVLSSAARIPLPGDAMAFYKKEYHKHFTPQTHSFHNAQIISLLFTPITTHWYDSIFLLDKCIRFCHPSPSSLLSSASLSTAPSFCVRPFRPFSPLLFISSLVSPYRCLDQFVAERSGCRHSSPHGFNPPVLVIS